MDELIVAVLEYIFVDLNYAIERWLGWAEAE